MSVIIAETIKELRAKNGISQEKLAEAMQVSMQAVSKWENNLSCPDIALLPQLAEYFEVSIDYLVTGKQAEKIEYRVDIEGMRIPDDDKIRIVQLRGNKVTQCQEWEKDRTMKLELPQLQNKTMIEIEICGACSIEGDVNGSVSANGTLNCGNIGGCVNANGDVNCKEIHGDVQCDGDVQRRKDR